jgi:caffeoyl-CoA O-methyltransferase
MFNDIPTNVIERMHELEQLDAQDRDNATPRLERLRQIPPETGRYIALWAAIAPRGAIIEIGTSAGYSTLWLSLACRATGRTLTTYEILPAKARLARETFERAQVLDVVTFVESDFFELAAEVDQVGFCFLDAEKEVYGACYEAIVPKLITGGILIADNAISHQEDLSVMIERALDDPRVDAMVVPIGTGELVCRKL